jgi:nucleotide-binding universal stress UspA family protein
MLVLATPISVSIDTILFATDFCAESERAAAYAKGLARRFGSTLEIAHVFDPSIVTTYEEAIVGLPVRERRQLNAKNLERVRLSLASTGVITRTVSLEAHRPAPALLETAKAHHVDLLVAGTQSKSGLERLLLGSVAEHLVRNAECPVLTVGPKARKPEDVPLVFRSIVYATDFSAEAAKAAVYALSFAEDSQARLYSCYVRPVDSDGPTATDLLDGEFERALKRMVPESSYDWCTPECVIEHGDAAAAILSLAERVHADLIVLGARRASFWLTHVERGLTARLLAEASCPVMTVS